MTYQTGAISAQLHSDRFVLAFDRRPSPRPGDSKVQLYSCGQRLLLFEMPVPEADGSLRLAFLDSHTPRVLTGSYYNRFLNCRDDKGNIIWTRELRKLHSIGLVGVGSEFLFTALGEPRNLLLLDQSSGRTRYLLKQTESVAVMPHGEASIVLRGPRGVWVADLATLQPHHRVLTEHATLASAGPLGFVVAWHGGFAGLDRQGSIIWKHKAKGTVGPISYNKAGSWIVRDATSAPNRVLTISSTGEISGVSKLLSYAPGSVILGSGALMAGSNGQVVITDTGQVSWTFLDPETPVA